MWRAPDIPTSCHHFTPMMSWHQTPASPGAAGGIMMVSGWCLCWCLSHLSSALSRVKSSWPLKQRAGSPCTCTGTALGAHVPVSNWLANRKHSFWSELRVTGVSPCGDMSYYEPSSLYGLEASLGERSRWDLTSKIKTLEFIISNFNFIKREMDKTRVTKLFSRWDSGVHSEYSELWSLAGPCQVWSK